MSLPAHPLSEDAARPPRVLHLADRAQDSARLRELLADAGLECELVFAAAPGPAPETPTRVDLVVCESALSERAQLDRLATLRDAFAGVPWLFVASTGDSPVAQASRARLADSVRRILSRRADDATWRALRRFSAGVAHDFNNLLTVINGHSGIALMREDLSEETLRSLQQIYAAGERASALTRRLHALGRAALVAPKSRIVNDALRAFLPELTRILGSNIAVETDLAPGLPNVFADPDLIDNVVLNLALRLRAGLPRSGGALFLRTRLLEIPARPPGRFVRLTVGAPSAPPLAGESAERLFEPYAEEKPGCADTALCLATAFGAVANHHGWIEAETPPDAGPAFHVFLPACSEPAAPASPAPDLATTPRPAAAPRGGETILFVEDEAPVRDIARIALQQHGYRVLLAASAKDALETWHWHSSRISLLVTDLVLPDDFTGLELARRLRADKPGLRVLCTSGCTRDTVERQDPATERVRFLQKPYPIRALAQAVREALDAP